MDLFAVFLTIALALYATESYSCTMNGFNLDGALIPVKEIRKGGPPRDGIPAINYPGFSDAESADYLEPTDRVIGVVIGATSRAYPVKIKYW